MAINLLLLTLQRSKKKKKIKKATISCRVCKITCVVLKYIVYQIIQIIFRILSDEFEDTKEVIVICKSTKDRQQNGRKKKDKKINNDLQNLHIKLKI